MLHVARVVWDENGLWVGDEVEDGEKSRKTSAIDPSLRSG